MGLLNKALGISIGIMMLFVLASSLVLPQFSTAWRYCQNVQWNPDHAGAVGANCTSLYGVNANTTPVTASPHTESGQTFNVDADAAPKASIASYCLNCDTAGGYRTTNQGLQLLVLVLAVVGFAIMFLPKRIG